MNNNAVAIIGMGCIFPGANGLKQYWRLIFNGEDAISDVPEDTHWSLKDYFSEDPATPDHTYCSRGGFIPGVSFDPARYGMPPNNLDATDTSQLLGLVAAEMALADAGYGDETSFNRQRTNIILGVTGTQELVIPLGARLGHPIWKKALKDSGISHEKTDEVIQRISNSYTQWQENSFPGLLGNVVPGRIANRLNLGGTNSAVDAACASSLSAINTAVMELISKKCDMSITGGVDTLNDIFMHMCFSKTGVLSHTGDARPFSENADGTVLGEGLGMIVLKRLQDAEQDKDKIYAVIQGVGSSSDGKSGGIYAPDAKGQLRSLKSAYDQAGIDPTTVELIEAHGTGTKVGDKIEFSALKNLMQDCQNKNFCALGSVKSMIGHTKAAAGVAGIIKSALSLYHKVIPPSLKAERPDPDLDINNTPFYINQKSKPWFSKNNHPRRSGVSAFGFGGSNFHIVLEEYSPLKNHVSWDGKIYIVPFSGNSKNEIKNKISNFKTNMEHGRTWDTREKAQLLAWQAGLCCRKFSVYDDLRLIFIVNKNEDPGEIAEKAYNFLSSKQNFSEFHKKKISDKSETQSKTRPEPEIFFGTGKKNGQLAFLFPGQGSQYPGMGRELCAMFPEAMDALSLAEEQFKIQHVREAKQNLENYIFPPPLQNKKISRALLKETDIAQPAIGAVSLAMIKILKRFGVEPDMACGHSFGELSALCSAGWIDDETFMNLAVARGRYMAKAAQNSKEKGGMLAIKAPLKDIETLIIENKGLNLILANRNTYDQGVVSGGSDQIEKALKICIKKKISAVKLPVSAAFHTHFVENAAIPFKNRLKNLTIKYSDIPVFSNTTGDKYPAEEAFASKILGNQLSNPVNFIKDIENMFKNNGNIFLEIGPKSVLTNLAGSILKDKKITAMAFDSSSGKKTGLEDLACVLCRLAASGVAVDFTKWEDPCNKPDKKIMRIPLTGANIKPDIKSDAPSSFLKNKKRESVHLSQNKEPEKPLNTLHKKGHEMTFDTNFSGGPAPENTALKATSSSTAYHAMEMIQKGLESMETLQIQTAKTHEKFLETQQVAGRALQSMMEQTRIFARSAIFDNSASDNRIYPQFDHHPVNAYAEQPTGGEITRSEAPVSATSMNLATDNYGIINHESIQNKPDHGDGAVKNMCHNSETNYDNDNHHHGKKSVYSNKKGIETIQSDRNGLNRDKTKKLLLGTVSRLTGFPVEMLELDMNIESDLGIDSIKRVEIVSELEKKIPNAEVLSPENMGTLKTLGDICTALESKGNSSSEADNDNETGSSEIMEVLITAISSLTGFPREMLEQDMDLESDLGIDSIKRVEILSRVERDLPGSGTISPDEITQIKTIGEIADHIKNQNKIYRDQNTGQIKKQNPDQPAALITHHGSRKMDAPFRDIYTEEITEYVVGPAPGSEKNKNKKDILRQIITLKEFPIDQIMFHNGSKITLPKNKKVYITQDNSGIAESFKKIFKKNGVRAEIINMQINDDNHKLKELAIEQEDNQKINRTSAPKDAAGLIIISDTLTCQNCKTGEKFLKSAFSLAKKFAPELIKSASEKSGFFTTVSFLGGKFGFGNSTIKEPVQGGLAGLAKTADLEWKDVLCRSLDMPDTIEKCMKNIETAVSLAMIHGPVEMGITNKICYIPQLTESPVMEGEADINNDDVIIITGGAKGITAQCALALAKRYHPKIILMGRSRTPHEEPAWVKNFYTEPDIKQAIILNSFQNEKPVPAEIEKIYREIISNREIKNTIQKIKSAKSGVSYFSVDIRDDKKLCSIIDGIRDKYGKITGIIHAAGVVEDKFIIDKTENQFAKVFDTKVVGMNNLFDATKHDSLKYFILFSSVAARTGNKGQADYAMANEVLNKTAQQSAKIHKHCKFISINWGPWEGGMVNPSLKREFNKHGIDLIPLDKGAQAMINEMGTGTYVEVVIGAHLIKKDLTRKNITGSNVTRIDHKTVKNITTNKSLKSSLKSAFKLSVGIKSCPVLNAHKIAGEPVVPFALIMELFAHGGKLSNPGLYFTGMDQVRLLKGIKPGLEEINLNIKTSRCRHVGDGFEVDGVIISLGKKESQCCYSQSVILLNNSLPSPPVHNMSDIADLKPCSFSIEKAYESILFHGKQLRKIKSITGISQNSIEIISYRSPEPAKWIQGSSIKKWTIDPVIFDSAFQAAIIWCYEATGNVCLPSYIANFRIYSSFALCKGNVKIIFTINKQTSHGIQGYFIFLDENDIIIASITGFEAVMEPSLLTKFKPRRASNAKWEADRKHADTGTKTSLKKISKAKTCLASKEEILSFATGNPSEAFGEKYTIFDNERQIARLPGPPYCFMDRVIKADHNPWEMKPGGWIEAEFDLPSDGWYFKADRSNILPFSILLEIALQPCGWLAAYAGSALKNSERLFFRNLGGEGEIIKPVYNDMGCLTMRARMTNVSEAGGMIIQDFDMEVVKDRNYLYRGHTNFGFFTERSLASQTGIRKTIFDYTLSDEELNESESFILEDSAPMSPDDPNCDKNNGMPSKALKMIDRIDIFIPEGGQYKQGYIKASKKIDPNEWFFKAHFFQDPVCPGSLGIESFLQLMRLFILKKFDYSPDEFKTKMIHHTHKWIYRGQIIPTNSKIEVHAHIKGIKEGTYPVITADGVLYVDGLCIYQMENFSITIAPRHQNPAKYTSAAFSLA